jgi:hypothetical protein
MTYQSHLVNFKERDALFDVRKPSKKGIFPKAVKLIAELFSEKFSRC